ncbi:MAG TPA: hypothetical protein VJ396_08320 [Acidiferrobacterales bacterium]|nr:hypothetical protein [Acidiferrobacterales bacterium]
MHTAPYFAALTSTNGQVYALAVIVILILLLVTRRLGVIYFVTTFPVTLAHELMHLLLGFLTHGQPCGFRVWPRRAANGYVLGSVSCRNVRWYNGLFIGFAPILLLPLALALLAWRLHAQPEATATEAVWAYAVACLTYASLPSWQDMRVALASSWLPLAAIAITALLVTGRP